MQIQVLSVQTEQVQGPKGPYNVVEVAYKNLSYQGKVESKKLMPFGAGKNTAITMGTAKPGDVYDIEVVKNDKGYNDWVKALKGTAASTASVGKPASTGSSTGGSVTTATKGGWETPEERAKKQVYIIRQSSLSTAVQALTATGKVAPKAEEVIELAKQFEAYVFSNDESISSVAKDSGLVEDITEDIPF